MGVESLVVSGRTELPVAEVSARVLEVPGAMRVAIYPPRDCSEVHGSGYVFETEVTDETERTRIAFRITFCHPLPALEQFITFVLRLAPRLELYSLATGSAAPEDFGFEYEKPPFPGLAADIRGEFARKRKYWIASFGSEEAAVTSEEALRRFVMRE